MCTANSPKITKLQIMSFVTSAPVGKHTCQICGNQTFKKTHLKLHEKAVHNGKKIQCPECEYEATAKSYLVFHPKSLHMGKKFQCPECEYKATYHL